jgi:catechol 2,3-dioxygenase-like lactoylglutathione lyase family enzyme
VALATLELAMRRRSHLKGLPARRPARTGQKGTIDMAFPAINHVALTVRDMAISGPWYRQLFDADPVVDEHTAAGFRHLVWILDGGTVFGIHKHEHPAPDERFSEFRVGLDHVGFGCADRAELETWMDRLGELRIQHGGIIDAPYGSGLSFRDPDGIALEFFAPPGRPT